MAPTKKYNTYQRVTIKMETTLFDKLKRHAFNKRTTVTEIFTIHTKQITNKKQANGNENK